RECVSTSMEWTHPRTQSGQRSGHGLSVKWTAKWTATKWTASTLTKVDIEEPFTPSKALAGLARVRALSRAHSERSGHAHSLAGWAEFCRAMMPNHLPYPSLGHVQHAGRNRRNHL